MCVADVHVGSGNVIGPGLNATAQLFVAVLLVILVLQLPRAASNILPLPSAPASAALLFLDSIQAAHTQKSRVEDRKVKQRGEEAYRADERRHCGPL